MNRLSGLLRALVTVTRQRYAAIAGQSERNILLGTILLLSVVSLAMGYVLAQCFSVDMLSTFLGPPEDCWLDWHMSVGRHCFSDYSMVANAGLQPNPYSYEVSLPIGSYQPLAIGGPAAAMLPHLLFGLPAHWLGMPRLGLIGYLVALIMGVLSPAVWAARGARGLERVVVFVTLGVAAIPAWAVIDRGNSAGFIVPVALVYLVALRREGWGLVALMVVLAAVIKPWFVLLGVVLLVTRQWRWSVIAVVGVATSHVAAYLMWPQHFPQTIPRSIHNLFYAGSLFPDLVSVRNVSFGRAFVLLPDAFEFLQTGGKMPDGFLAGPRSMFGYVVAVVVVVSVLALGRRIPAVMAGIALLATATLSPPLAYYYYLVFVLPIAALIVRDPEGPPGSGIFDGLFMDGPRRRVVGVSLSLAAAFSIAQLAIPAMVVNEPIFGQLGVKGVIRTTPVEYITTVIFTSFLWLIACAAIIVSYARRPVQMPGTGQGPPHQDVPDATAISTASDTTNLSADFTAQRQT